MFTSIISKYESILEFKKMIFLIIQIAFFLLLATLIGIGLGWWFAKNKNNDKFLYDKDVAMIENKRRLDQCHKENAKLRREAKQYKEQLEKVEAQVKMSNDVNLAEKLEVANARIQALMDEVQIRDDMISALEKKQK